MIIINEESVPPNDPILEIYGLDFGFPSCGNLYFFLGKSHLLAKLILYLILGETLLKFNPVSLAPTRL
jgi:hypothetical protein